MRPRSLSTFVMLLGSMAGLMAGCGYSSKTIDIVAPPSPALTSITVTPASATVRVGATQQFIATGGYADGSSQNITSSVTWSSSNGTTASIDAGGIAAALTAGTTLLTASLGAVAGHAALTVQSATLVSIAVTAPTLSLPNGTSVQFVATGTYQDGSTQVLTNTVTWTSSTPAHATIGNLAGSKGLATGIALGTTIITATDPTTGIVSPGVTLTVIAPVLVSISISPAKSTVSVGATQAFTATGLYTDGSTAVITGAVTWTAAAPAVAGIGNAAPASGVATGLALGSTLITAADPKTGIVSPPATLIVAAAYAYAVNFNRTDVANGSTVSQYSIGADGQLTALATPSVATGPNPFALALDQSGQYLYVVNFTYSAGLGSISEFAIGADGSLLPLATPNIAAGDGPNGLAVSPSGPYLYVVNYNSGTIGQYVIGAGGLLTVMPTTVVAGANPATITFNPAGTFAYVTNFTFPGGTNGSVSQYAVGPAGALSPLNPPTVASGGLPNDLVVSPSGQFAYVVNSNNNTNGNTISQFSIGSDGTLTPLTPATVATGKEPWSMTLDATGTNAYVPNRTDGTVWHYTVAANGQLTFAASSPAGSGATSLAIDPSGRFAYVTDRDAPAGVIAEFAIAPDGSLTALAPPSVPAGLQPAAIITAR